MKKGVVKESFPEHGEIISAIFCAQNRMALLDVF